MPSSDSDLIPYSEPRDDGLPKPPREGFQIVLREVKEGIEELHDVIAFVEKRVELDHVFYKNIEELLKVLPSKSKDAGVLWQAVSRVMQQSLTQQKKCVEKGTALITELKRDLTFQKAAVDEIASDIIESFDEYKAQKERLIQIEQEYKKRSQVSTGKLFDDESPRSDTNVTAAGDDLASLMTAESASSDNTDITTSTDRTTASGDSDSEDDLFHLIQFATCEGEYRKVVGSLARRRKVQVKLLESAYRRFVELEHIRLVRLQTSFEAFLSLQAQRDKDLGKIELASIQEIKQFDTERHVTKYKAEWENVMTLPAHIWFHDSKMGPMKNLTFGTDLVDHLCVNDALISPLLSKAIKEIGYRGMDTRNLYSTKVDPENVKKLCDSYEKDASKFEWDRISDIGIIVNIVKRYFITLPEPLFPYQTHSALDSIAQRPSEDDRLQLITKVLKSLPAEHLNTLIFILEHLSEVLEKIHRNKMDMPMLAQEMAPCLIRPKGNYDVRFAQVILMDLMRNYSLLLGNLPKPK